MAVKKLGKVVLIPRFIRPNEDNSHDVSQPCWNIIGESYRFGLDPEDFANKLNLKNQLEDNPEPPCNLPGETGHSLDSYMRSRVLRDFEKEHPGEWERYQEKQKAFDAKHSELIQRTAIKIEDESTAHPIRLRLYEEKFCSDLIYCMFKGNIYKLDRTGYSDEEIILQIMDLEDKERVKFERLKHKFALAKKEEAQARKRDIIPEEVRVAVWRRDEGKCVKCGSREKLEYDHIIPHSKGGSDTVRNIELLCEKCNREKSDNVG